MLAALSTAAIFPPLMVTLTVIGELWPKASAEYVPSLSAAFADIASAKETDKERTVLTIINVLQRNAASYETGKQTLEQSHLFTYPKIVGY